MVEGNTTVEEKYFFFFRPMRERGENKGGRGRERARDGGTEGRRGRERES